MYAPGWVKCVSALDGGTIVFVHVALATHILPERKGSRICFAGSDDDYIDVKEAPEHLLSRVQGGH